MSKKPSVKKPTVNQLVKAVKGLAKQYPGTDITRDFFRNNTPYKDAWSAYWPNFPTFLQIAGVKGTAPAAQEVKPVEPLSPAQKVEIEKEKVKAKQSGVEEQLRIALATNVELQNTIDALTGIKERTPQITLIVPKVPSGTSESVAVFVGSDFHGEEKVLAAHTGYKNEFNLEICDQRITRFWQGQYRLFDIMRRDTTIKQVVLALLGDFISGSIHEDLAESNLLPPTDAMYWVQCRIVSGIKFLLEQMPSDTEILVVCHSGNHGRMTKKQRGNTEAGNSLERFMYFQLRDYFAGEPRLKFQIAEGYHTFTHFFDGKYIVRWHHGHAINYGGGLGGITIPVNKAIDNWNKAQRANLDVFGHFHQFIDAGNFVCNGSLIGYNDFAVRIKASFEPPQQAFFLLNKKWNSKTMVTPVFVAK